jgi:hypothetical protein
VIENVSHTNHCSYCLDDGVVLAFTRPAGVPGESYDEMAPCPRCEKGRLLEFPPAGSKLRPVYRDGFWRGRPFDGEPQGLGHPLPPAEAKLKVAELTAMVSRAIAENPIYKRKRLSLEARVAGRSRLDTSEKVFEKPGEAA